MTATLTRMWIDQPSTLQPLHHLNGTNVLARHEYDDTYVVYFLEGATISQHVLSRCLSKGWLPEKASQDEVVEVVAGLHRALSRMIDKYDADSKEAEWLSHSNELHRKLTGKDVVRRKPIQQPYALGKVTGDWLPDDVSIPAYTNGSSWNGYAMPHFTAENANKLAALMPDLQYEASRDAFLQMEDGEVTAVFRAEAITVDGQLISTYAIGAGYWCWYLED